MHGLSPAAASRGSSLAVVLWSHCHDFSCRGARALCTDSMAVAPGALERSSAAVGHGLRCPKVWCLPRPGIEPVTPALLKVDSKPLDQQGSLHFILVLPFLTKFLLQYYQICPCQADEFPKALL